ncbi:phytoene desaturase family protein [Cryobacterium ruanii]|uniref:NAD(P)/FAD-dependent oxidoreductase n=1 Tax=Cryobacterium ruanii TaxID=1259197 RepID=A0A4R9AKK8_9MICO|nr:NAD(P)/FAD-dependent oxidoreductase [Cryobacterium ruanii]TFD64181.1 NAD(P)/FAD-dependent oxidoreductase [Cryobacterium ruanii]
MSEPTHDVVIIGGGHNGLVAAAYLAQAGRSVLVLEREPQVGGAAISANAFAGVDARLSRYSYLVSLLPTRIIRELGLDIELARRRYSSYTPGVSSAGLLVDHDDADATRASFARLGAEPDFDSWNAFYDDTARLARAVFPTVCEPLLTRSEARRLVGDDALWTSLIERPLGEAITDRFANDLVRGVVATDGLIGTFTSLNDPSLDANRCFLYHVIGNETGDWAVPTGGMGAVTGALERAAREAGARLEVGADVETLTPDGAVTFRQYGRLQTVTGAVVLANVAPWVLRGMLAAGGVASAVSSPAQPKPEGAQVKVNLLLTRLPRLREASVSPEAAFGGTLHINESYEQLQTAFEQALAGLIPAMLPCEIYCHSLTDPSILSPELAAAGAHTLTVFALHTPNRALTEANNDAMRAQLQAAVLRSLNSVLAEPVEALFMTDADGHPCIETKTTLDLEHVLNMPGGNIFHGALSWPFLEDDEPRDTSAERWGVATEHSQILICGAGARRGGGVSGLGGHNAAMAVLEGL